MVSEESTAVNTVKDRLVPTPVETTAASLLVMSWVRLTKVAEAEATEVVLGERVGGDRGIDVA